MKLKFLLIFSLLFVVFFSNAQTTTNNSNVLDNDCPPPKEKDYKMLCSDVASKALAAKNEYYYYSYEKRILELSCVNIEVDDEETIKRKVQLFWNKYKNKCKCDSVTFNIPNVNILKFAITKNTMDFIEVLVLNYELDINFTDPEDMKNLLDYMNDEIEKMKTTGASQSSVKVYEKYRDSLIAIGGKPSK